MDSIVNSIRFNFKPTKLKLIPNKVKHILKSNFDLYVLLFDDINNYLIIAC